MYRVDFNPEAELARSRRYLVYEVLKDLNQDPLPLACSATLPPSGTKSMDTGRYTFYIGEALFLSYALGTDRGMVQGVLGCHVVAPTCYLALQLSQVVFSQFASWSVGPPSVSAIIGLRVPETLLPKLVFQKITVYVRRKPLWSVLLCALCANSAVSNPAPPCAIWPVSWRRRGTW
jgi:hypothetical protein